MTIGHATSTLNGEQARAILDLAKRPSRGYPFSKLTAPRLNALRALSKRKVPLVEFCILPEACFRLTVAGKLAARALKVSK